MPRFVSLRIAAVTVALLAAAAAHAQDSTRSALTLPGFSGIQACPSGAVLTRTGAGWTCSGYVGSAGYADRAGYADAAGTADTSGSSGRTGWADNAGWANNAGHANTADRASAADFADRAGYADNGGGGGSVPPGTLRGPVFYTTSYFGVRSPDEPLGVYDGAYMPSLPTGFRCAGPVGTGYPIAAGYCIYGVLCPEGWGWTALGQTQRTDVCGENCNTTYSTAAVCQKK